MRNYGVYRRRPYRLYKARQFDLLFRTESVGDGVDNIILRGGGNLLARHPDRTIQLEDGTALLDELGNDIYAETYTGSGVILLRETAEPPVSSLPKGTLSLMGMGI